MVSAYQIETEREHGFRLHIGGEAAGLAEPWDGWRVKYRPFGSRGRWSKFVTDDDVSQFSAGELQEFCRLHAEGER